MNKILSLLLLIGLTACANSDEVSSKSLSSEETDLIDYLFEGAKGNQPGANVLVVKDGKIILQRSYGLSHVEKGVKSIAETNYRIASVSKQFTAMAIMILEDHGKLSYTTKLTEIFPEFPIYGNAISVRHLLTHQSGVVDYDEFIAENRTDQMLDREVLDSLRTVDSTYFFPGSQYRYSNSGYAVLAQIVEKLSGSSFADFMNKEIFTKLNMTASQVFEVNEPIKNRAFGYSYENETIIFNDQSLTSAIQGDGGIYMSVLDYLKWDQALYTDKLIPKNKLEDAFYHWDDNTKTDDKGYGYGWSVDYQKGIKILSHSGGSAGFESRISRIPSLNLSIVIFTNRDGHDRHLMHRNNALISIFSDYEIPLPVEVIMKKAIDQQGVNYGIELYDNLKNDSRYSYNSTTPNFLGFEYFRMGKFKEAKALFIKDTEVHPNHFGGYYGLGRLYKETKEIDKAIVNFEKILDIGAEGEEWIIERSKRELKALSE